jgi:hypothetical protein
LSVYGRGVNGDVAPVRTLTTQVLISGRASGLAGDELGEIFTASGAPDGGPGNVSVFPAGAQGNATAVQVITNGINSPVSVAVSRAGNFLYVANAGTRTITVYHRAFGLFSLVATIPPPTVTNVDAEWASIAVDAGGLIYAVPTYVTGLPQTGTGPYPTVTIFERTANGPFTQHSQFYGFVGDRNAIVVDTRGLAYVAENFLDGSYGDNILIFGPRASGLAQILTGIAGLHSPVAMAIVP